VPLNVGEVVKGDGGGEEITGIGIGIGINVIGKFIDDKFRDERNGCYHLKPPGGGAMEFPDRLFRDG